MEEKYLLKTFPQYHDAKLSAGLKVSFKYLNGIYEQIREIRMTVIQAQQFIYHTSDNYQQYHAFATQRISFKAGIMHVGMVFILILIGEYLKPKGTIYLDGQGVKWEVISSTMPIFSTCVAKMKRCAPFDIFFQPISQMVSGKIEEIKGLWGRDGGERGRASTVLAPFVGQRKVEVPNLCHVMEVVVQRNELWARMAQREVEVLVLSHTLKVVLFRRLYLRVLVLWSHVMEVVVPRHELQAPVVRCKEEVIVLSHVLEVVIVPHPDLRTLVSSPRLGILLRHQEQEVLILRHALCVVILEGDNEVL